MVAETISLQTGRKLDSRPRSRKASRGDLNLGIDGAAFAALLAVAFSGLVLWLGYPEGTGLRGTRLEMEVLMLSGRAWIDLHQWAGVAFAALMTIHLALHYKWVLGVSGRLLGRRLS